MKHDLTGVIAQAERALASAPNDAEAAGWRRGWSQDVAIESLLRVEGLAAGARVLDVGCGLGALKAALDRRKLAVDYTGIDLSPKVIEAARARHPGARFEVRDLLAEPLRERFDFVFASGTLSYRVADQGGYVADLVGAMWASCDVALAFNMLSAYAFAMSPTLQRVALDADYAWPERVFGFCRTIAKRVSVLHDTDTNRFDVFLYRRHHAALDRYLAVAEPPRVWSPELRAAIEYHLELDLHAELLRFLDGAPPCAPVASYRGQAHLALGDAARAEAAFREAIALDPAYPWAHLNLGRLAARARRPDDAIAAYRRAVEVAPELVDTREALVRALLAAGRRDEARAALAAMPPGPLADVLGSFATSDAGEARRLLERALAVAPQYVEALDRLADLDEREGRPTEAMAGWRRALAIAPGDASIARRIARLRPGDARTKT